MSEAVCAKLLNRLEAYLAGGSPDMKLAEAALASVMAFAALKPDFMSASIGSQTHGGADLADSARMEEDDMAIPARDAVLETTELLENILACMGLEELGRARRVCKRWQAPSKRRMWSITAWTTPLTLNPLLARTIILPKKNYPELAALAPLGSLDITERAPLHESRLQAEPPSSPLAWLPPDSPVMVYTLPVEGPPCRPVDEVDCDLWPLGQRAWKRMLISDPPVYDFQVRHVNGKLAAVAKTPQGAHMTDLLDALESLEFDSSGTRLPKKSSNRAGQDVHEFEILLPLYNDGSETVESPYGAVGVWRALKTRLKCQFEDADGSDGNEEGAS
ncbi:hypothetical protein LTR85_005271 [Meristemomyces frigidus]|nr:hypothetical protein LTR85_005271 [Meristemomyces frigidus]